MQALATLLIAIPAVILSAEHQEMSRVAVGDPFPAIASESTKVSESLGKKATVVAVPGGAKWMEAMLTGDLKDDFSPKYGEKGVRFITLGAPSPADGITSIDVGKPVLTEALGEGRMPRVYVLDPAGKVVWFDLEYTLSTHRELHAALDELIGE